MSACIDSAKVFGIGMASVKHSNHFGMSAAFVRQANRAGYMSLVFTNSSPAVSLPFPYESLAFNTAFKKRKADFMSQHTKATGMGRQDEADGCLTYCMRSARR